MTLFARLALLWGVTALAPTFAATPSWEASPRFETIADAERIVDGIATVLAQGDSGLIWMGTARGLVRYDGYQLRRYTLGGEAAAAAGNSSFVRSLLVDQRGLLWMGTDSEGLWRFDPVHEVWTQFTHREQDGSSISAGAVRAFALGEGGRIWLGTQGGGLDRLDPATGRFEHVGVAQGLPDTRIYALATDARGALWVGTWSGLARCMPATLRCETVFSHSQGSDLAGEVVSALQVLPDGSVWAGTRRGDLARIDPQGDGRWLSRGERRNDPVFAFWAGRADELWVGRTSGIEVRSRSDGSLRKRLRRDPTRAFGQGGNDVVALLQDRSGWVWFGSYGGGLQRFMVGGAGLGVWRG
ncbi:MAG TPA: two-component regulator propeller domain-containing protein, partial [Burkholderiaceae bacterium]